MIAHQPFEWAALNIVAPFCRMRPMQDTQLYQLKLGLSEPWTVSRVRVDVTKEQVESGHTNMLGASTSPGIDAVIGESTLAKGSPYSTSRYSSALRWTSLR